MCLFLVAAQVVAQWAQPSMAVAVAQVASFRQLSISAQTRLSLSVLVVVVVVETAHHRYSPQTSQAVR
jgi:hypothetical protein